MGCNRHGMREIGVIYGDRADQPIAGIGSAIFTAIIGAIRTAMASK